MTVIPGSALAWARCSIGFCIAGGLVIAAQPSLGQPSLQIALGCVAGLGALAWTLVERGIILPLQAVAQSDGDLVTGVQAKLARLEAEKTELVRKLSEETLADEPEAPQEVADWSAARAVFDALANGKAPEQVPELQDALEAFSSHLTTFQDDLKSVDAMASNPLSTKRMTNGPGWFGDAAAQINAALEGFSDKHSERSQIAGRVHGVSTQILEEAEAFSTRIESQASALQETAATMEEVSATVATNAESASEATKLSSNTAEIALRGRDVADKAVHGMRKIDESARKITEITSIVDGIAFQTNLLSLNAAVEAARAGEAGKGFAVVASEVRTLAQRAAEAARSISELVAESTVHVSEGVTQVEATGSLLVEIQAGIEQVVKSISEISAATREQASGIGEISQTLSSLDGETQTNAALVTRTIANAHQLGDLATSLGAESSGASSPSTAFSESSASFQEQEQDAWETRSTSPDLNQASGSEELQTYVPRPSHNLPNRGPQTATALSVADEDGWEEF